MNQSNKDEKRRGLVIFMGFDEQEGGDGFSGFHWVLYENTLERTRLLGF